MSLHVFHSPIEAASACAARIAAELRAALAHRETASLAVSGGSTPKLMFDALTKLELDWSRIHLFWVDERGVEPDDEQSNYLLARLHLIDPVSLPKQNVHRMRGEWDAADAAAFYSDEMAAFFGQRVPAFDVVQCGMGDDGHTASLFPGEALLLDRRGTAAGLWVEKKNQWRVTLLPASILAARCLVVLACGADKAGPLHAALHGPVDLLAVPAQLLRHAEWFTDHAAAG